MKYILEENIRHILSERFILTEAEGEDTFDNTIFNKMQSLKTIAYNYIQNNSESDSESNNVKTLSSLYARVSALNDIIQKTRDPNVVKGQAKEAIDKINLILQRADSSFETTQMSQVSGAKGVNGATLRALFDKVKSLAISDLKTDAKGNVDNGAKKQNVNEIKNYLQIFTAAVTDIMNKADKASDSTNINKTDCENLVASLDHLEEFYKTNRKTGEPFTTINNQIDSIINLYNEWKADKSTENTQNMLQGFKSLSGNINKVLQNEGFESTKTDNFMGAVDWAKRFEKALDKNKFWDEYYKQVWGVNAELVRALGEAFRAECETMGFTEKTNPFITFIKTYIINKHFVITKEPYETVHNAIAGGKLSIEYLNSTNNPVNILHCKNLYTKNRDEIKNYIELYEAISKINLTEIFKDDFSDSIKEPSRKRAFNNLISYFNTRNFNPAPLQWVILFNSGNTKTLSELISIKTKNIIDLPKEQDLENAKLRPVAEVRTLLQILDPTTVSAGTNKSFDDSAVRALFKVIPTSSAKEAGKWVVVMITTFLLPKAAIELYNKYPDLRPIIVTGEESIRIKNKLLELGTAMTKTQIEQVLVELEKHSIKFRAATDESES